MNSGMVQSEERSCLMQAASGRGIMTKGTSAGHTFLDDDDDDGSE